MYDLVMTSVRIYMCNVCVISSICDWKLDKLLRISNECNQSVKNQNL
ncbi:hypothetical protein F383_24521 [Gossypium arboreum]|uniref:Uncharacterized protein n=1 Tax=Gossypium arboreum TaxID=29729 RepID=A0A0B0NY13_GOSAR|nr:hypothetical protein F383_24521 [Gossypium arboreum]